MIHDVDKSLREMLLATAVRGGNVEISFDMPDKDWAAKRQGPALNVYLYEISEDLDRRHVQYEPRYDDEGIVVGRQTPPRRFRLEYLISAWADRAEDEHRMLSAVLSAFVGTDVLPEQFLQLPLGDVAPVGLTIALPTKGKSTSDFWRPMGSGVRPSLHLVVNLPLGVRLDPYVGPPVLEGPVVALQGPDGQRVPTMAKFVSPDHAAPAAADATGAPAAAAPEVREVIDAGRFRGGRQLVERDPVDVRPGRRIGVQTVDPRTPPAR